MNSRTSSELLGQVVDDRRPHAGVGRGDRVQILVLAVDGEQPGVLGRDAHDVGALGGVDLVVGVRQAAGELRHRLALAKRGDEIEETVEVRHRRATIVTGFRVVQTG